MKTPVVCLIALSFVTAMVAQTEAPDAAAPPARTGEAATATTMNPASDAKPSPGPSAAPRRRRAKKKPTASPTPSPTPEQRRSFFQRMFGLNKPKPSPSPALKATPTPKPKPAQRPPRPTPTATPAASGTPKPARTPKAVKVKPTPTPAESEVKPTPTPTPKSKKRAAKSEQMKPDAAADTQPDAARPVGESGKRTPPPPSGDESARYREARAKALQDADVLSLQEKVDSAASDEATAQVTREYYKTLFNRMRKIDPSLKERIDRTEAATLRRIERQP